MTNAASQMPIGSTESRRVGAFGNHRRVALPHTRVKRRLHGGARISGSNEVAEPRFANVRGERGSPHLSGQTS